MMTSKPRLQNLEELPEACTVDEACRALGVGKNFAYDAIRRGDIKSIRLGRKIIVPRAELQRLLSAGG